MSLSTAGRPLQKMGIILPEELLRGERVRIIKAMAVIAFDSQVDSDKVRQYMECVWPGLSRDELLEIVTVTIN